MEQGDPPRSFFKSRSFWVGTLLWLAVVAAVWMGMYRKPINEAPAVSVSMEPAEDGTAPKRLTIKTGKDGNYEVVDATAGNSTSPWDADGIADFAFHDTAGQTVTKSDLLGKPWIVCFVFTHCAYSCPMVTKSMRDLQDQLKDRDFRLVTLTVDPERDTPEILKGYGERFGADFSKWMFLGGDQRDIYQLIHGSFKMPVQELVGEKRKPGFEFIHSNNIMLVDERGVVRGKFDATKGPDMATLRREIQKLAKEVPHEHESPDKPAE